MSKKIRKIAGTILSPASLLPESVRNVVYPLVGSVVGGPAGAAAGSGLNTFLQGGNLKDTLLSAGGTYVGSNLGGAILGDKLGTVGSGLNSALGSQLGSTAANALGSNIANTTLGSIIGGKVGGDIASSYSSGGLSGSAKNASPQGETAAAAFKPQQEAELAAPSPNFAGMSPLQQSTNLATGGVYGGGQGPGEQQYFLNLINRRLVDESGNVDQNLNDIKPIESSYLDQLGLGGYGNANDLLEAISKRKKAA